LLSDTEGKSILSPLYADIHDAGDKHKHADLRFFFKSRKTKVQLAKSESKEIRWFNGKELDDPKYKLKKHVKFYGLKAIELSGE
jgi:hypothetical protein